MHTNHLSRSNQALLFSIVYHTVPYPETKRVWKCLAITKRPISLPIKGEEDKGYLSLTLQQGSIISSLAATLATEPLTTLLRYTIGVLPMSCDWTVNHQNKMLMHPLIATRCMASIDRSSAISEKAGSSQLHCLLLLEVLTYVIPTPKQLPE